MAHLNDAFSVQPLPVPAAETTLGKPGAIELRDIRFSFNVGNKVLDGVSFEVAPGTMTALVGPSGSGKSTVTKLISRSHDIDSGKVLFGGVDERDRPTSQVKA